MTTTTSKRELRDLADRSQPGFVVSAFDSHDSWHEHSDFRCDGVDDDVQIQAALDELNVTGGRVILSEGTFNISASITLDNFQDVVGMGWNTILVPANDLNVPIFNADKGGDDVHDIRLADFYINGEDATGLGTSQHGIQFVRAYWIFLDRIKMRYTGGAGVRIQTAPTVIHSMEIRNFYTDFTKGHAIHISDHSDTLILGGELGRSGEQGWPTRTDTGTRGIYLSNSPTCVLEGIHVWGSSGDGILCESGSNDCVINGVVVEKNSTSGIAISGSDRCIVVGNLARESSSFADNVNSGVSLFDSDECLVASNICFETAANGQKFGVDESGTSNNNQIVNNQCLNNESGGVSFVGAATMVRHNSGFVTENSGIATILDSTTSITVTHGLDVTPTLADISIIMGENPTNAIDAFWVDTITSTQFNINSNDPGVSNLDVAWRVIVL